MGYYLETMRLALERIDKTNERFVAQYLMDPALMVPAVSQALDEERAASPSAPDSLETREGPKQFELDPPQTWLLKLGWVRGRGFNARAA